MRPLLTSLSRRATGTGPLSDLAAADGDHTKEMSNPAMLARMLDHPDPAVVDAARRNSFTALADRLRDIDRHRDSGQLRDVVISHVEAVEIADIPAFITAVNHGATERIPLDVIDFAARRHGLGPWIVSRLGSLKPDNIDQIAARTDPDVLRDMLIVTVDGPRSTADLQVLTRVAVRVAGRTGRTDLLDVIDLPVQLLATSPLTALAAVIDQLDPDRASAIRDVVLANGSTLRRKMRQCENEVGARRAADAVATVLADHPIDPARYAQKRTSRQRLNQMGQMGQAATLPSRDLIGLLLTSGAPAAVTFALHVHDEAGGLADPADIDIAVTGLPASWLGCIPARCAPSALARRADEWDGPLRNVAAHLRDVTDPTSPVFGNDVTDLTVAYLSRCRDVTDIAAAGMATTSRGGPPPAADQPDGPLGRAIASAMAMIANLADDVDRRALMMLARSGPADVATVRTLTAGQPEVWVPICAHLPEVPDDAFTRFPETLADGPVRHILGLPQLLNRWDGQSAPPRWLEPVGQHLTARDLAEIARGISPALTDLLAVTFERFDTTEEVRTVAACMDRNPDLPVGLARQAVAAVT